MRRKWQKSEDSTVKKIQTTNKKHELTILGRVSDHDDDE